MTAPSVLPTVAEAAVAEALSQVTPFFQVMMAENVVILQADLTGWFSFLASKHYHVCSYKLA